MHEPVGPNAIRAFWKTNEYKFTSKFKDKICVPIHNNMQNKSTKSAKVKNFGLCASRYQNKSVYWFLPNPIVYW